jgi:iron complex outermembrane receptor protein
MGRDISLFFNRPVVQEASWDVDYFVQEVRLVSDLDGKFQYILGLYYEEMDVDSPRRAFFAGDLAFSPFGDPAGTGDNLLNDANLTSSLDQQAAFAELSYDISDQVSLTVGARRYDYERDSVSLSQGLFGTNVDSGGDVNNADETGTNYKVNLTYEPSDDSLIYAQWAEGFRPGNTVIPPPKDICDVDDDGILDGTNLPFADSFDADTLESYELGLKTSLMDNKMTFNVAVYHNDWNDIPISVQSPTCGFSLVGNAATARTQGFEVESVLRVSTDLQLIFGGSYVGSPPEK